LCWATQSCCSKSPKRATTKPNPIKAGADPRKHSALGG